MKRINNIKIYEDLDNNALIKHICKKYHILYEDILDWHIIKKSIDARNKDNIHYLYNIAISFKSEKKYSKFDDYKKFELPNINIKNKCRNRYIIKTKICSNNCCTLQFNMIYYMYERKSNTL